MPVLNNVNVSSPSEDLSHVQNGQVSMVNVAHKANTLRSATAQSIVQLTPKSYSALNAQHNAKGEVLNTARIAGIMAAKRCAELIPLCHSLPLSFVGIDFSLDEVNLCLIIQATCKTNANTGVEMEALTAASISALTVYDMCKAADKGIVIKETLLLHKSGGKSGEWLHA